MDALGCLVAGVVVRVGRVQRVLARSDDAGRGVCEAAHAAHAVPAHYVASRGRGRLVRLLARRTTHDGRMVGVVTIRKPAAITG